MASNGQWGTATVGDVADIRSGVGFPKSLQGRSEGDLPFYKVGDISRAWAAKSVDLGDAAHFITVAEANSLRAKPLPAGSVVFAKIGEAIKLNRRALTFRDSVVDNNVMGVIPDRTRVHPRYLYYVSTTWRLGDMSQATAVPSIRKGDVAQIQLSIPTLDEQELIAQAIDRQLTQAEAGRQELLRVRVLLRAYGNAILSRAWVGRADADTSGDPADWVILPEIAGRGGVFKDGDWVESKDQDPKGDVRLVQLQDIGDGTYLDRSRRYLTSSSAARLRCTYLASGDVLVARMPDPLGRACQFPGDAKPSVTAVDVCIIRPAAGHVDARWLMWMINTPQFRRRVASYESGSTRKRISRSNLARIAVPLRSIEDQRSIAAAIERQMSAIDSVSATVDSAYRYAATLGQQVIQAGIEGRLHG